MTSPLAIIDTNIVVAGLLSNNAGSPVCEILDGMLSRRFSYLLSTELLDEYREVLLREKIRKCHALSEEEIDSLLQQIVMNAIMHEPFTKSSAPDRGDDHLWQLLADWKESILVTGDQRLIDNPPEQRIVCSPREFLDGWF
jgi:uncharacterized protein